MIAIKKLNSQPIALFNKTNIEEGKKQMRQIKIPNQKPFITRKNIEKGGKRPKANNLNTQPKVPSDAAASIPVEPMKGILAGTGE